MLLLKGMGAIALLVAGSLAGIRFSEKLYLRRGKLNKFYIFINELSSAIKTGEEIDSILQSDSAKNLVYREDISIKPYTKGLNSEDIRVLTEFFSYLGLGDVASQVSRCEVYRELVKKRLNLAEQEVTEKAKLYSTLGFFSGLFVVILLI